MSSPSSTSAQTEWVAAAFGRWSSLDTAGRRALVTRLFASSPELGQYHCPKITQANDGSVAAWRKEVEDLEKAAAAKRISMWKDRMQTLKTTSEREGWTKDQILAAYNRAVHDEELENKQHTELRKAHLLARAKGLPANDMKIAETSAGGVERRRCCDMLDVDQTADTIPRIYIGPRRSGITTVHFAEPLANDLPEFKLDQIGSKGCVVFVGPVSSKMTTVMANVLENSKLPRGLVIAADPISFVNVVHPLYIHSRLDASQLSKLVDFQRSDREPMYMVVSDDDGKEFLKKPVLDLASEAANLGCLVLIRRTCDDNTKESDEADWWFVDPQDSPQNIPQCWMKATGNDGMTAYHRALAEAKRRKGMLVFPGPKKWPPSDQIPMYVFKPQALWLSSTLSSQEAAKWAEECIDPSKVPSLFSKHTEVAPDRKNTKDGASSVSPSPPTRFALLMNRDLLKTDVLSKVAQ